MGKAVLMSIQPKWCEKIANGEKTIEVRKSRPKLQTPFKVYIYCTMPNPKTDWEWQYKPNLYIQDGKAKWIDGAFERTAFSHYAHQKVIGEFVCDRIDEFYLPYPAYFHRVPKETQNLIKDACLTMLATHHYIGTSKGYAWHISQLKIYDEPKELSEFGYPCPKGFNDETNYACYREFGYGRLKFCKYNRAESCGCKITRPPQSWCYVEQEK